MNSNHIDFPILNAREDFALKWEVLLDFLILQKGQVLLCDKLVLQVFSDCSYWARCHKGQFLSQDGFYMYSFDRNSSIVDKEAITFQNMF